MDFTSSRPPADASSPFIKSGQSSCCVITKNQLAATNSNKLTRLPRPVQVHKSHSIGINSSSNPGQQTFDKKGTCCSKSDFDIPWDKICSYCNIGVVENNFTFAGVLLCVLCFPFGFAWLFCMMESQCPNCGKIFL